DARGWSHLRGLPPPRPHRQSGLSLSPAAMAWNPPSTWITSPVVIGAQSDRRTQTMRATGSGFDGSHPRGDRRFHSSSKAENPGIDLAATVPRGPADTALTRMLDAPRSRAR